MQIFIRNPKGFTSTLNVESNDRIYTIKRKLQVKEGIRSDLHLGLIYNGKLLEDGHTLAHYKILKHSTLRLFLSQHTLVETWILHVKAWSQKEFTLHVKSVDTIDDVKAKIQEKEGIPPHKQLLFFVKELIEDGSRTLADYGIHNHSNLQLAIQFEQGPQSAASQPTQPNVMPQGLPLPPARTFAAPQQTKRARPATQTTPTKATPNSNSQSIFKTSNGEATATLNDLMPESQACPSSSVLTELEVPPSSEMAKARNKEQELEATICGLKAENKKIEEELTVARDKEKESEANISGLMHKTKVFSDQCASYESKVDELEVENKKIKEELMNADKKYYAGARAAGYAEGLREGKAKRLKSIEFLDHLTDASMRYFNHGFDSCQKQAEQQGFSGQLNKDSALKDAPDLKGWESSDQPH